MRRTRSLIRLLAGGGILAGVVLLAGFVVLGSCHFESQVRAQRLANCSTSTVRFTLRPPGGGYQLALALPQVPTNDQPPPFRGEAVIRRDGRDMLQFPVVSWKIQTVDWLNRYGQAQTYLITSGSTLRDALKAGETYDVTVTFTHPPPSSASLWLAWVE